VTHPKVLHLIRLLSFLLATVGTEKASVFVCDKFFSGSSNICEYDQDPRSLPFKWGTQVGS
jgi:hypothetical protein